MADNEKLIGFVIHAPRGRDCFFVVADEDQDTQYFCHPVYTVAKQRPKPGAIVRFSVVRVAEQGKRDRAIELEVLAGPEWTGRRLPARAERAA